MAAPRSNPNIASALLDVVDDAILVIDRSFQLTYMNNTTQVVLGWDETVSAGASATNPMAAVHPDDVGAVLDALARVMNGVESEARAQFRVRHPDGKHGWKPVAALAQGHLDTPGINGVVVTFRDLEELLADRSLVDSLTGALEHTNDFVAVHRADGSLLYANGAFRRLVGWDELPSDDGGWPYVGDTAALIADHVLPELAASSSWNGEYSISGPAGPITVALSVTGRPETCLDQSPLGGLIIVTGRDISTQRQLEADQRFRQLHDHATRLPNRFGVERHLSQLLDNDTQVALVSIEIDTLRELADTHQSEQIDGLVRSAVQRLRQVTSPRDLFCRTNSDTFLLIATGDGLDLVERARTVAELFHDRLRTPFELGGTDVYLHAHLGVVISEGGDTPTTMLRKARLTVEAARTGRSRDRIEVYNPAVWERVQRRAEIERGLYEALANGRLRLRYQPIVDLETGRTVSFEALVRWEQPDGSMVPPNEFLDVADQVNLIADVDTFVLRTACHQLAEWGRDDLDISVNVSASQLLRSDLVEVLAWTLSAVGISPERLTLELTENNLYVDMEQALRALDALRELGVKLALDDFGTGYSSLSHLREFEVDTVKIDRSFVANDARIVDAVVRMSSSFKMLSVAEGVETVDQLRTLRDVGCQFGQGYLFSPPVTGDEALEVADAIHASHVWAN
jgi:predicted signal transduction protein with EAL and GGDEF domain